MASPPAELLGAVEQRALAAMSRYEDQHGLTWSREIVVGDGITTGAVASIAGIRARTPERVALNEALTWLRRRGYLHFEYDPVRDEEVRWWLTPEGLRHAREAATQGLRRPGYR